MPLTQPSVMLLFLVSLSDIGNNTWVNTDGKVGAPITNTTSGQAHPMLCSELLTLELPQKSTLYASSIIPNKSADFINTHNIDYAWASAETGMDYLNDDTEKNPLILDIIRILCELFNTDLAISLQDILPTHNLISSYFIMNLMVNEPIKFLLTDTKDSCYAQHETPNCTGYLFFNPQHPTSYVNNLFAYYADGAFDGKNARNQWLKYGIKKYIAANKVALKQLAK
jgi:hypothetical protein